MNPDEMIRLDAVSVQYRAPQERIGTFKEYTIRWVEGKVKQETFLALDNVSLTVQCGEVFGLIGKNGAGKSTLLKLIARVLCPTVGRVRVRGRVAPLLEMGAGFHAELTGRENIYLNGAMLGFTRQEMDEKFDRIVEFAELGDFIEAPIRTYSSGMLARLGFAVATDTRPEILIVDEILSVGDEAFQRKSFERILSFRERGATILLVTHNMALVETMCQRAAWLDQGQVKTIGPAKSVVDHYLGRVRQDEAGRLIHTSVNEEQRWGNRKVEITNVRITDQRGDEIGVFYTGQTLAIHIEYTAHEAVQSPVFGMAIHRQDGTHLTGPNTAFAGLDLGLVQGRGEIVYTVPSLPLLESLYHVSLAVTNTDDTEMFDYHDRGYPFRILNRGGEIREQYGLLTLNGKWQKA